MQRTLTRTSLLRIFIAVLLALSGLGSTTQSAQAAELTLIVDTTLDSNDPGYQGCSEAPDDCTLRGAISKANADPANSYTIELAPGELYVLSLPGSSELNNATGDLNMRASLTINGSGAIIDAAGIDRVMQITSGKVVVLNSLTITNGHAPDGSDAVTPVAGGNGADGGGILVNLNASVRLTDCVVTGNRAGNGGAGYSHPAGNGTNGGAGGRGGGIYVNNEASAILTRTRIEDNAAGSGGPGGAGANGAPGTHIAGYNGGRGGTGGAGGGLYAHGGTNPAYTTELYDCTVLGNNAGDGGSGGPGGRGASAIEGLSTAGVGGTGGSGYWGGDGGGLSGVINILSGCTLVENHAGASGSGGSGGDGGNDGYLNNPAAGGPGGSGGDLAGRGGAVNFASSNSEKITNSTLFSNYAGLAGAGGAGGAGGQGLTRVGAAGPNGTTSYAGEGGAIQNGGNLYLNFVTISVNYAWVGPGINNNGTIYARNSLIAGNWRFNGIAGDVANANAATPFNSDGYNLFGTYFSYLPDPDPATDIFSAQPGLLPLGDNGGLTLTVALEPTSPAVNQGDCSDRDGTPVTTDQRGWARPSGGACDIGAFERPGCILQVESGSAYGTLVGTEFEHPLRVSCVDPETAVDGLQVTFTAPVEGASLNPAVQTAVFSGGFAEITAFANFQEGTYTVTASTPGSPDAEFSLNNFVCKLQVVSGDDQGVMIDKAFDQPLVVTCEDPLVAAIDGLVVIFIAPPSGASLALYPPIITFSGGFAKLYPVANSTAGAYTVTAFMQGSPAVEFSLTNWVRKLLVPLTRR